MNTIKPIYCRWLLEHIDQYVFISEEAKELRKELNLLASTNNQDLSTYNRCYTKFTELFYNDPYNVLIGMNILDKGIITYNHEYYLEENEFGVLLPLKFFNEYGLIPKRNLLESKDTIKEEINSEIDIYRKDASDAYEAIHRVIKEKKQRLNFLKYFIFLICTGYIFYKGWFYSDILKEFSWQSSSSFWLLNSLALALIIIIRGLFDLPKFIQQQYIKKYAKKCKLLEPDRYKIDASIEMIYHTLKNSYPYSGGVKDYE